MMRIHYAPSPKALNFTGRLLLRRQISFPAFSYGSKFHSTTSPNAYTIHCKEIWIYVFSEKELCGLSPNFHIHSCVCARSIYSHVRPTYFPQACSRIGIQIRGIYKSLRNMNIGIGTVAAHFLSCEYLLRFFGIVSLQCMQKENLVLQCIYIIPPVS